MAATLTDFLLARIAEDEATAREAVDPERPGVRWRWEVIAEDGDPLDPRWLRTVEEFPTTSGVGPLPAFPLGYDMSVEPARGMAHIARWDPARVLAECEARRAIVEVAVHADVECARLNNPRVGSYEDFRNAESEDNAMDKVIRFMAVPYADHPDYRDEWRPE